MRNEPETLEDALQMYVDAKGRHEDARFEMAEVARYVGRQMGRAGLVALAQASHHRRVVLEREAAVAGLAALRESLPTITFLHLDILSRLGDAAEIRKWAERAADEDWSPAQLRRAIAAANRKPETAFVVLRKADSSAEKFKSVVDQAAEVGVLDEVADRAASVVSYVEAKKREVRNGDGG